jgi:two-component system, LuxR family, response regulator FixJ
MNNTDQDKIILPKIYLVEDDEVTRTMLVHQLTAAGLTVVAFNNAASALAHISPACRGCMVVDLLLPDATGVQLQADLRTRGVKMPMIYVTATDDIALAVRGVLEGAMDLILKPVDYAVLSQRVNQALERDAYDTQIRQAHINLQKKQDMLTQRETDVAQHLLGGASNKQVGLALGISQRTVEVYRARLFAKMGVDSVVALANMMFIQRHAI